MIFVVDEQYEIYYCIHHFVAYLQIRFVLRRHLTVSKVTSFLWGFVWSSLSRRNEQHWQMNDGVGLMDVVILMD